MINIFLSKSQNQMYKVPLEITTTIYESSLLCRLAIWLIPAKDHCQSISSLLGRPAEHHRKAATRSIVANFGENSFNNRK